MRVIEQLSRVDIESEPEMHDGGVHIRRMSIPKSIMVRLLEGMGIGQRVEVEDEWELGQTTYLFVPESEGTGGVCPGPAHGPLLVAETADGDRLMIEVDRFEVDMLLSIDLTNMP